MSQRYGRGHNLGQILYACGCNSRKALMESKKTKHKLL